MRHFGVKSKKPTCLWSNSSHISKLNLGPVPKGMAVASEPLAVSYTDARGKKRCTGKKKALKESQKPD